MNKPQVSVIIATYNSEKTLPLVLRSIEKQSFDKEDLEVLIIDGGSVDKTLKIAKKYGCRIVNNPQTEPVYAKILGFHKAKGRYHVYLDHDEVLINNDSIKIKLKAIKSKKRLKAVTGDGYVSPGDYPFVNRYINEFGDPFSFFIYKLSKDADFFVKSMKRSYEVISENNYSIIFDLSKAKFIPIIELVAGGTMIDSDFFRNYYSKISKKIYFLGQAFNLMIREHPYIGVTKKDQIVHYSSDNIMSFLKKIKWRVKNNVFFSKSLGEAGFKGRNRYQSRMVQLKQYFFIPYVLSIIFPLADSLWLAYTRRNLNYFIHLPLSIYTLSLILYYYILKVVGVNIDLRSYDEGKKIS